jgi:hypothetical protein
MSCPMLPPNERASKISETLDGSRGKNNSKRKGRLIGRQSVPSGGSCVSPGLFSVAACHPYPKCGD